MSSNSILRSFLLFFPLLFLTSFPVFSEVIIESRLDDVYVVEIDEIPIGPDPLFEDNCRYFVSDSESELAKEISKRGWVVTSEVEHGPYHLISFAGDAGSITSGMCIIEQTNIAIFKDKSLLGLIYTGSDNSHELAALELNQKGSISVISGAGTRFAAYELEFRGNRITFDEITSTIVCGTHIVPQLSRYPLTTARKRLTEYGWGPVDWESYQISDAGKESSKDEFYESARLKYGLPEIQTCSGTGVGYCSLLYQNDDAYLEVTTVGGIEGAIVLGYYGQCK